MAVTGGWQTSWWMRFFFGTVQKSMLGNVTVANNSLAPFLKATRDAVCMVLSYELCLPSFTQVVTRTNQVNWMAEAAQWEELG